MMFFTKSSRWLYLLLGFFFLMHPSGTQAQEEFRFAHFMQNKLLYNPAYAGSTRFMEINLLYRNQWAGTTGAPETSIASVQTPLNYSNVGLGLSMYNDKIGLQTSTGFFASYAYQLKVGDQAQLSMGIQGGLVSKKVRWSEKVTNDPNDPVFPDTDITALTPNFGLGFYYHTPKFYLGLSAPHLLSNQEPTEESLSDNFNFEGNNILYYINAGVELPLSPEIDVHPSILLRTKFVSASQLSAHVNFVHESSLALGVGINGKNTWIAMLGYRLSPKLGFSYSYGRTVSHTAAPGVTNHEIILNYNLSLRKNQITSPRYF